MVCQVFFHNKIIGFYFQKIISHSISFGTFITELTKFGGGPETEGNSVEAAQNTAAQNQNQQQQDAAVAKNQSNESLSMTFGEKLQKRLMEEKRTDYVRGLMEDGWYRLK